MHSRLSGIISFKPAKKASTSLRTLAESLNCAIASKYWSLLLFVTWRFVPPGSSSTTFYRKKKDTFNALSQQKLPLCWIENMYIDFFPHNICFYPLLSTEPIFTLICPVACIYSSMKNSSSSSLSTPCSSRWRIFPLYSSGSSWAKCWGSRGKWC